MENLKAGDVFPSDGRFVAEPDQILFEAPDRKTMIEFLRSLNEFLEANTPVGVEVNVPDDLTIDDRVDEVMDERRWPHTVTVYLHEERLRDVAETVLGADWHEDEELKDWGRRLEGICYEVEVTLTIHRDGSIEVDEADFPDAVEPPKAIADRFNLNCDGYEPKSSRR